VHQENYKLLRVRPLKHGIQMEILHWMTKLKSQKRNIKLLYWRGTKFSSNNTYLSKHGIRIQKDNPLDKIHQDIPFSANSFWVVDGSSSSPCPWYREFVEGNRLCSSSTIGTTFSSVGSLSNTYTPKKKKSNNNKNQSSTKYKEK